MGTNFSVLNAIKGGLEYIQKYSIGSILKKNVCLSKNGYLRLIGFYSCEKKGFFKKSIKKCAKK